MGRKDISKVYDKMKPDETQKKEMFERIMEQAGSRSISSYGDNEISVVRYSKKRSGSVFGGIAAAAVVTGIILGGVNYMNRDVQPFSPDNEDISPVIKEDGGDITNKPEDAVNQNQVMESGFPGKNDTVLTDNEGNFKAEFLRGDDAEYIGEYNGSLLWKETDSATEFYYRESPDFKEKHMLYDADGNAVSYVCRMFSGGDYLFVISLDRDEGKAFMNVFDSRSRDCLSTYETDMENTYYNYYPGMNGVVYRIVKNSTVQAFDIYGNMTGEYTIDSEFDNEYCSYSIDNLYVFKNSGEIFITVSSKDEAEFILLDSNFEKKNSVTTSLVNGGYIAGKYDGGYIFAGRSHDYTFSELNENLYLLKPRKMSLSPVDNSELSDCTAYEFNGTLFDFIAENEDGYHLYKDGALVTVMKNSEELYSFNADEIFEFGGIICISHTDFSYSEKIYCDNFADKTADRTFDNVAVISSETGYPEKYQITSDGRLRTVTYANGNCIYEADINDTENVRISYTGMNTDKFIDKVKFFTENFIGYTVYDDKEDEYILSVYDTVNGVETSVNQILEETGLQDSDWLKMPEYFVLADKDILAYEVSSGNSDIPEWYMLNLNTMETKKMKNSVSEFGYCFMNGKGRYDYFFLSDDGVYGGVIDEDEFRYCRILNYENADIETTDGMEKSRLFDFIYIDDSHFCGSSVSGWFDITAE